MNNMSVNDGSARFEVNVEGINSYFKNNNGVGNDPVQDPIQPGNNPSFEADYDSSIRPPEGNPPIYYPDLKEDIKPEVLSKKLVTIDSAVREILRDYAPKEAKSVKPKEYRYVVEHHYITPWYARPFFWYRPSFGPSVVQNVICHGAQRVDRRDNDKKQENNQMLKRVIVGLGAIALGLFASQKLGVIVGKWNRADDLSKDVKALFKGEDDEDYDVADKEGPKTEALNKIINKNAALMKLVKEDYAEQKKPALLLLASAVAALVGAVFFVPPLMVAGSLTGLGAVGWMVFGSGARSSKVKKIQDKAIELLKLCEENYPIWNLYTPSAPLPDYNEAKSL